MKTLSIFWFPNYKMVQAYVLINTKPGKEKEVLEGIKKMGIKLLDSSLLYGEYDIIIKIDAENIEKLRSIVLDIIRKLDGVERTITLIAAIT